MSKYLHKTFAAEVKESNEDELTVTHFISTERLDRGSEILYADGMQVNGKPVVLAHHGYGPAGSEPIAKALQIKPGRFNGKKGVQAKTQFWPDELGKRLWAKTVQGFMPNWSVGWRPLREEIIPDRKTGREVRHVYEWELLEYSLVGVPMQPDAQTIDKEESDGSIEVKIMPCVCCEGDQLKRGDHATCRDDRFGEIVAFKDVDGEWIEVKPYPNEHACRLQDPGKYIRIRRQNDKFGDGIHAIWGVQSGDKPVELQAIRFSSDKHTAAAAKTWLKKHDYSCKVFEPATGKEEPCGCQDADRAMEKVLDAASMDIAKKTDEEITGATEGKSVAGILEAIGHLVDTDGDLALKIDCLTERLDALEKQIKELGAKAEPGAQPEAGSGQSDNTLEFVLVNDAKPAEDQERITASELRELLKGAAAESFAGIRAEVRKMMGKID